MAEGLAIGSGFAQGLSKVLLGKRQRDQEESFARENRNVNLKLALLPEVLKRAQNYGDVQPFIDEILGMGSPGGKKGKPKAGEPDVHGILEPMLSPVLGGVQQDVSAVEANVQGEPSPAAQASRPSLFGVPLKTNEELTAEATAAAGAQETAKLTAQTDAKMAQAKRLREIDPEMSVEDSLIAVGLKIPKDQFGTVPTGGGVFNKATGEITEAPSAKVVNIPGQLGERTRELQSLHPDWTEDQAKRAAATSISEDRAADRIAKQANAESIQANRAIQNTLLKMQEAQGGITPNNAAGLTVTLRKDWLKAIEPLRTRETYIAKLNDTVTKDKNGKTMIQRDRNAATQTIINSFNRLLEEGNAVREGEYQRSEELAPLLTRLGAMITAAQVGGGNLTDPQLESLAREGLQIAAATKAVHEEGLQDLRTAITSQLGRYKLPEEDVFGNSKVGVVTKTVTINGKPFTGTQAQIDAFKRRFPDAN